MVNYKDFLSYNEWTWTYASRGFPIIRRVTWTYASWWISYNAAGDVDVHVIADFLYILYDEWRTRRVIIFFSRNIKDFSKYSDFYLAYTFNSFEFFFFFLSSFSKIFFFFRTYRKFDISAGISLFDIWWCVEYINAEIFV